MKASVVRPRFSFLAAISGVALAVTTSAPARATEFHFGELEGHFDTTISVGASVRTEDPASSNFCTTLGGTNGDCGKSDGNLNYDQWDFTSTVIKATHDIDLRWRNLGSFVRLNYFYDAENEDGSRRRTALSGDARNVVGADFELLDAYISGDFLSRERPISVRIGNQVISWGESTFIQNGINVINPIDVGRLRVPGSELREALLPIPAVWASLGVTDNLTLESFYQWAWKETVIDPPGSFFSNSDGLGQGGELLDISQGHNDCALNPVAFGFRLDGTIGPGCVRRGPDVDASDTGQWGVALRLFAPQLNASEFGLYFLNTHSRLPFISGSFAETASQATARLLSEGVAPALLPLAVPAAVIEGVRAAQEYPDDIRKFGASFSTTIERLDIALQGEASYAIDQPIQLSEGQLVAGLLEAAQLAPPGTALPGVRLPKPGEFFSGALDHDVWTGQATLTKIVEPGRFVGGVLGADQLIFVAEAGFVRVRDFESENEISFQGAVTPQSVLTGSTATQRAEFASASSWGYVTQLALVYNNAFLGVNLQPVVGFRHDVAGTTPAPLGNFVEHRKGLNLALRGDFLNRWSGEISYTNFFGGGQNNPLRDRDFISFNLKYSF